MEKNIIDVFNGFSETQPDKIACTYKNTTLTYAELDKFSDILANSILQKKVASGSKIAVILPRSHHILISILAIHKTGCVYVPIDPEFPKHRIASILTEVEPCKIISSSSIKDTLDKDQTLYIDITSINFNIDEGKTFFSKLDNHTYSHIFFTSGTTGKPKGVVSTHKNLIHYLSSAKNQFKFNSNDIFISVARFTFSISLFELLLPLYVGGQVKIIPTDDIFNLKQLAHHIQNATVFHFGPSLMKILLPYIQENYHNCSAFKGVKHVSSGGDMVPIEIIRSLNLTFASAEVYVIYGSSEINCMGCYYFADRQSAEIKRSVGRTFDNVSLKILDDNLAELPMGTVGNIYFSGKGLATGYLHQAELSNNLFIIIEGVRYYNIGDIGKLDADGDLELHGRNDFQVQIKGMRVELFEVENQLKKQANIVDCVISSDKNGPSYENRLIAYVVLDNNINANSMQFKKYLSQYLPDYMIPSIYIKLTNLPLNFNGKIDRKSLPSPIENQIKNTVYKEATNAIELELISIFKQLFKSQTIGIEDDFFDLGGDSLMAVNLLISIENKYQKHIFRILLC